MNKLLLLVFLFTIQIPTYAQLDTISLVKVTGEYSIKVKPDYVILGISVNKTLTANSPELKTGFRIFEREDTQIRLFSFDDKDISETFIHIDKSEHPVYVKDVFLTVENISKLDEIMFELHKMGFTNYKYVEYRVLNLNELKDKARVEALKSARDKAVLLAGALGQSIGKAHSIEDLDAPNYNWYSAMDRNNMDSFVSTLNSGNYLLDPGYIVVISRVKVSFDLLK